MRKTMLMLATTLGVVGLPLDGAGARWWTAR